MSQAAEQAPTLAPLRQHRKVLTDLQAGRGGGDRVELAADLVLCLRLHIKAIVLR